MLPYTVGPLSVGEIVRKRPSCPTPDCSIRIRCVSIMASSSTRTTVKGLVAKLIMSTSPGTVCGRVTLLRANWNSRSDQYDMSRLVIQKLGSRSIKQTHNFYICYAQTMDRDNPWIALLKVWIRALRWQSMDCADTTCAIHGLRNHRDTPRVKRLCRRRKGASREKGKEIVALPYLSAGDPHFKIRAKSDLAY